MDYSYNALRIIVIVSRMQICRADSTAKSDELRRFPFYSLGKHPNWKPPLNYLLFY